jgi:hypothetical protein
MNEIEETVRAHQHDIIRLRFDTGAYKDINVAEAGLDWPPPERIMYGGIGFVRRDIHVAQAGRAAVFDLAPEDLQQALQEAAATEDGPRPTIH